MSTGISAQKLVIDSLQNVIKLKITLTANLRAD